MDLDPREYLETYLVLKILYQKQKPLSIYEIQNRLAQKGFSLQFSSIYDLFHRLERKGMIVFKPTVFFRLLHSRGKARGLGKRVIKNPCITPLGEKALEDIENKLQILLNFTI